TQSVALDGQRPLGPVAIDEAVRTTEYVSSVEVVNLSSAWAPVPYPAVEVSGLDGAWAAVPYNRTVISRSTSTQGQTYDVRYTPARPTLEQAREATASGGQVLDETTELPAD